MLTQHPMVGYTDPKHRQKAFWPNLRAENTTLNIVLKIITKLFTELFTVEFNNTDRVHTS